MFASIRVGQFTIALVTRPDDPAWHHLATADGSRYIDHTVSGNRPLQARTRMSVMRSLSFLFAASLLTLAHPVYTDDKPPTGDVKKLQGVWKGKTGRNGIFDSVMTIKGDAGRLDNTTPNGKIIGLTYKFTIDERAKPFKTMDKFDIVRYGGTGNGPNHVFTIYEFLDDNTIRFCNGFDKYPTEFKRADDNSTTLSTFKRVTEDAKPEK